MTLLIPFYPESGKNYPLSTQSRAPFRRAARLSREPTSFPRMRPMTALAFLRRCIQHRCQTGGASRRIYTCSRASSVPKPTYRLDTGSLPICALGQMILLIPFCPESGKNYPLSVHRFAAPRGSAENLLPSDGCAA